MSKLITQFQAFSLAVIAFSLIGVNPLYSHEKDHTHPALAAASFDLLDSEFYTKFAQSEVLMGTIIEDEGTFREPFASPRFCFHFYNPSTGQNLVPHITSILPFDISCGALDPDVAPTAKDVAQEHWDWAVVNYPKSESFQYLGRVLHLVQDMTSPAHVHSDVHGGFLGGECGFNADNDDFEDWGWCKNVLSSNPKSAHINDYVEFNVTNDQVSSGRIVDETLGDNLRELGIDNALIPTDNSPDGFIHEVAQKVFDITSFDVVLTRTPTQPESEFQEMFPDVFYDAMSMSWFIEDIGFSFGECGGTTRLDLVVFETWWPLENSDGSQSGSICSRTGTQTVGRIHIENTEGDADTLLTPKVWKKEGYFYSENNTTPLVRLYGDILYSVATSYGAGLLKTFAEEVDVPMITVEEPSSTSVFLRPVSIPIQWQSLIDSTELMTIWMKRESFPKPEDGPDGINWIILTQITPNDEIEEIPIPITAAPADDWRFYVTHTASGATGATSSTHVIADNNSIDLSLEIVSQFDEIFIGDQQDYRLLINNNGPGNATNVILIVNLPPGSSFSTSVPSGICSEGDGQLSCSIDSLMSGEDFPVGVITLVGAIPDTAPPSLILTSPNNSDIYAVGSRVRIDWFSSNIFPDAPGITVSMKRDSVPDSQETPDNQNWIRLQENSSNDGIAVITVPESATAADDWRFFVGHLESGTFDGSNSNFSILGTSAIRVSLTSPNSTATFTATQPVLMEWSTVNASSSDHMTLSMKRDSVPDSQIDPDGINWIRFTEFTDNDGIELAIIPDGVALASDWRFYVGHNNSGEFDGSDETISIADPLGSFTGRFVGTTSRSYIPSPRSLEEQDVVISSLFHVSSDQAEISPADNVLVINTKILIDRKVFPLDIKPGSDVNPINPRSRGKIPVAILSSATFNATTELDRFSLTFGRTGDENSLHFRGNGQPNCGEEDVNEDGFVDLVCHFFTQVAGFQEGDTKGFLKGQTTAGESFEAMDGINIVPPGHDSDSDGIEDDVEDEGPNNGDSNGDGRFDAFQPNVATLRSAVNIDDFITLQASGGCTIAEARAFHPQMLTPDPSGLVAPQGFLAFILESCGFSDTIVFFHGETSLAGSEYRRLGPTPDNQSNHWYEFENANFGTAVIDGATVATARFQLRDGELGDDDLILNGRIVDPGGPARNAALDEIPTLSELGLVALILLLLGTGIFVIARRRSSAV